MKRALILMTLLAVAGTFVLVAGDAARKRADSPAQGPPPSAGHPKTTLALPSATAAIPAPAPVGKPAATETPPQRDEVPSPEKLKALVGVATDPASASADREAALIEIGHSPSATPETVARVALLATAATSDLETRFEATGALKDLALREDLVAATRAALLAVAEKAPSADLRTTALTSVRASGASEAEVASLAAFLGDQEATVRVSAALALATADANLRTVVAPAVEQAFARETDPAVGGALVSVALRMAAGDPAILDRLAATDFAKAQGEVAQKLARFRALMAAGETDPSRIEKLAAN